MKKPVKVCVIGAGRAGKQHTSTLRRFVPEADVVALVDPVVEALNRAGDEFGITPRFTTLEEAIEKVPFDAAVITTPTFTHKSLALVATGQGKHIFLEKPMALNLFECDEINAAVLRHGVLLQLGFMRRFEPEFTAAANRIEAGEIGRPMMIKSLTHGPGLPPAWARDLKTSNGNLAEVNSHDWDCVRWLMSSNFERVYTEVANFKGPVNHIDVPHYYDNSLVSIRFESGALGSISGICPCRYGYDARVEIVGELGIMQIGQLQGQAVVVGIDRDRGLVTPIYRTWPDRFAWGYIYEMQHFIECVARGKTPKVGGEEGRWAVAGVLAATRSMLEGRPVYLREIFEG
jgi:myo-inositol 2-dehydrogenase/D-chiro-inositol 1-dehydrogenase/scyllo-inositol 2-dehydrogenase (NAD+)